MDIPLSIIFDTIFYIIYNLEVFLKGFFIFYYVYSFFIGGTHFCHIFLLYSNYVIRKDDRPLFQVIHLKLQSFFILIPAKGRTLAGPPKSQAAAIISTAAFLLLILFLS